MIKSDGTSALYYELPQYATQLYHLIIAKNMNAQMGEIFRACYRYGEVDHSPKERDLKKIIAYAKQELERLENENAGSCDDSVPTECEHEPVHRDEVFKTTRRCSAFDI